MCSGIAYYVQNVVNNIKGPVFVTAFSPLSTIITAILGAVILAEQAHLGRYFILQYEMLSLSLILKYSHRAIFLVTVISA